MSNDGRSTGFAVVGMLILWIAGVAFALSQVDQDASTRQLGTEGIDPSAHAAAPTPEVTVTTEPTAASQATPRLTSSPSPTALSPAPEQVAVDPFGSERIVRLSPGEHVGYQFDRDGEVIARKAATLSAASAAHASERATIEGVRYVLIVDGIWADYYLPESERVQVDG